MENNLALDLKVARRKAGLTQADLAHLLSVNKARISQIERGVQFYTTREICQLSMIYDQSLYGLMGPIWLDLCRELSEQLGTLPSPKVSWMGTFNRRHTLSRLAERLEANLGHDETG